MTLTAEQVKALEQPLDKRRISKREGGRGKSLSYLQSHDVKRTANRIFGYAGWSYTVRELICLGEEPFTNSKGREGIRVGYRAVVTVSAGGVERGDVGYGDAMEYTGSRITPHELAAKEAVSDAAKRCLASFGDQFGLILYGDDPAKDSPVASGPSGTLSPTQAQVPATGEARSDEQAATITQLQGRLYRALGETTGKQRFAALRKRIGHAETMLTAREADAFISDLQQALVEAEAVPA